MSKAKDSHEPKNRRARPAPVRTFRDRIVGLRRVKASDLVPHPENWRIHGQEQHLALRGMLEDVGFATAVLARELPDGRLQVIDGHLRASVADTSEVPVLVLDVTEQEARKLLATVDPITAMAAADRDRAANLLAGMVRKDAERLVQFTARSVPGLALAKLSNGPPVDPDDAPALPEEPRTKPGSILRLGRHALLCADSFDPKALDRLLGKRLVDAVLTDPPFAIYGSSTGVASDIADDKMVRPFFEQAGRAIASRVKWFGQVYVHCDWRSFPALWEGFKRSALAPKNLLVWDKGGAGLGSNWSNTHELVAYFAKLPKTGAMTSRREAGQRAVLRPNLLRFPRVAGDERLHNAAKPVALLEEIITAATDEGQAVLDLFAGSGSTLIAAEKAGRSCFAVEAEPAWCDVIASRWERFTGKTRSAS